MDVSADLGKIAAVETMMAEALEGMLEAEEGGTGWDVLGGRPQAAGFRVHCEPHPTEGNAGFIARGVLDAVQKFEVMGGNLISLMSKVDPELSLERLLQATGRVQFVEREILAGVPPSRPGEVEVVLFKVDQRVDDAAILREYALRNLQPADPCLLAQLNLEYPSLADSHPNRTHWQDSMGRWCFAAFDRWAGGERAVYVFPSEDSAVSDWWFAGVAA